MNVSPLDLRQQTFGTAFRGYNKVEVTSFLGAFAEDYEKALLAADRMGQDVTRMEAIINELRAHENTLKSTLMTAQKLADDVMAHAEVEAQRIIRDAEARAELLLEKTQSRLEDIHRDIDGMRLKRRDAETSLESTIQGLRNTLEYVREQDTRERDDKTFLRKVAG
jgi:cell division initiation protein